MKSVLISIQPYWVFLIIAKAMGWKIDKEKTIEVRKNFPKAEEWNKLVKIYCSKDRKSFNRIPKEYQPLMQAFLGKVIGEFVCDRIDEFHSYELDPSKRFYDIEKERLDLFLKESCLSYDEVCEYRKNLPYIKPLYGWHISNLKIYDKPKELSEFKHWVNDKDYDGWNEQRTKIVKGFVLRPIERPPQSWCYVEELGDKK